MTDFHVDTDSLTGAGRELTTVADGVAAALTHLRTALESQGAPWGGDEVGKPFGDEYSAVVRRAVTAIASYEVQVRHAGQSLPMLAELFSDAETVHERRLRQLRVPRHPVAD